MSDLEVNDKLDIPETCLRVMASRSSGPGGQNVNKLNTRITLVFDLPNCPTLTDEQKGRLLKKLSGYADKEGCLQVSSQRYRSQHANRADAEARLAGLIAHAIKPAVKRRKTTVPRAAIRKRLQIKRQRSETKRLRSSKEDD